MGNVPQSSKRPRPEPWVQIVESPSPDDIFDAQTEGSLLRESLRVAGITAQYNIAVNAKKDRDDYIQETLKEKLFYLSGTIDGQTVRVEANRLEGIELRLSPQLVDVSSPVIIEINDRKRFEGVISSSVSNMLESAYEDWDFQRPAIVRKSFSIQSR